MINKPVLQLLKTVGLACAFMLATFMSLNFQAKALLAKNNNQAEVNQVITSTSRANLAISEATTVLELFSILADSSPDLPPTLDATAASNDIDLAATPAFVSNLKGSTLSMDWGDVDRDGDLDLAVGSSRGTAVYTNENGILTRNWFDGRGPAQEVRWFASDDGDEELELVVVGDYVGDPSTGKGRFYIYPQPENKLFTDDGQPLGLPLSFSSTVQLLHVAPGDYNGDGQLDLVVSTNLLKPPDNCPIYLIKDISTPQMFPPKKCFKSITATASLDPADFDNDGDLDFAASQIQSGTFGVYKNNGNNNPSFTFIPIITDLLIPPSDAAWGDYDADGYLDLAVALPFSSVIHIYRNQAGTFTLPTKILPSNLFLTPRTLDWADFNNDGHLDLAVAEIPPKIYDGASNFAKTLATLDAEALSSPVRILGLRGIDLDHDLDLDLALINEFGSAMVFTTSVPPVSISLTPIGDGEAQSVAWGDADSDGYLDLLFGGQLYLYSAEEGNFKTNPIEVDANATVGMFGEVITDNATPDLDILVATSKEYKLYKNVNGNTFNSVWKYSSNASIKNMALGYFNNDSRVDILLGNNRNEAFFIDYRTGEPISDNYYPWISDETGTTYDLAWADYNQDGYLDYAAANGDKGVLIYRNINGSTFLPVGSITGGDARAVAWVDYNADQFPDLTVGYSGTANSLYKNEGGTAIFTPTWRSNYSDSTTSLAWADWDNDGDLDLAVGNQGPDQIFEITGSLESPQLQLRWTSSEDRHTTDLAWGDKDGDGDLDLAVSQTGAVAQYGVYENHTIWPGHLTSFTKTMPLPRNASYVVITRPGTVPGASYYSSGELVGYNPLGAEDDLITIPIYYQLFDPDGQARGGDLNTEGDPIYDNIKYEYSTNGGSSWQAADGDDQGPITRTKRSGEPYTFVWEPPVTTTDTALFRITVIHQKPTGPVQRSKSVAVSPPFRLRVDNCNWPANPTIEVSGEEETDNLIQFLGKIEPRTGQGELEFMWDFDNGEAASAGQLRNIRYDTPGLKTVVLTVTTKAKQCELANPVAVRTTIDIGGESIIGANKVYLPMIIKQGSADTSAELAWIDTIPLVTQLQGHSTSTATHLVWAPSLSRETVLGYQIYRAAANKADATFELLATVPAESNHYIDATASCEQIYFVTAFNSNGQSNASSTSYYSPSCPQ